MKSIVKLLVSIGLLYLLMRVAGFDAIVTRIAAVGWPQLIILAIGYCVGQLISAFKWWLLLKSSGLQISFTRAVAAYFLGMYVNVFGLGLVGGDVARGVAVAQQPSERTQSLSSVVVDRLHGLFILTLVGLVAAALVHQDSIDRGYKLLMLCVAAIIIVVWFALPHIMKSIAALNPKLDFIAKAAQAIPRTSAILISVSLVSLVFHILQIGLHGYVAAILGVAIPWSALFVTVPVINFLSSLPISWQGLGVREAAYSFFWGGMFLTPADAISMGALWFFAVVCSAALGTIAAVSMRFRGS